MGVVYYYIRVDVIISAVVSCIPMLIQRCY